MFTLICSIVCWTDLGVSGNFTLMKSSSSMSWYFVFICFVGKLKIVYRLFIVDPKLWVVLSVIDCNLFEEQWNLLSFNFIPVTPDKVKGKLLTDGVGGYSCKDSENILFSDILSVNCVSQISSQDPWFLRASQ